MLFSKTTTLLTLACLLGLVAADVQLERSISSVGAGVSGDVFLDHGCTDKDAYGSNHCTLNWGDNATATIAYKVPTALTGKSVLKIDLKVSLLPLSATCAICGAPCELIIPVIKLPVTIDMPDCPISADAYSNLTAFSLPDTSPVPIKLKFTGTVELLDDDGNSIAKIQADGEVGPK
jgi:hypothetical protein